MPLVCFSLYFAFCMLPRVYKTSTYIDFLAMQNEIYVSVIII